MTRSLTQIKADIAARTKEIAPLATKFVEGGLDGGDLDTFRRLNGEIETLTGERIDAERTDQQRADDNAAAQRALALHREYNDPVNNRSGQMPRGDGQSRAEQSYRSMGERFVNSEEFTRYRDHGIRPGASSSPLVIGSLFDEHYEEAMRRYGSGPDEQRALITSPTLAPIIQPQRLPGMFSPDQRELRMRDIFPNLRTSTNSVEFVKEGTRTNNAAEVAEATSLVTGLKPESGFTLLEDSSPVRTLATMMYITRAALADADQMQGYIDQLLRRFVEEREDRQLLLGDGVAPNLRGINATPGIQNLNGAYFTTTMPSKLDRLRRSKTAVRITGRGRVSAFLLNPQNLEEFETLKTNATAGNNEYAGLGGGPFGGPAGRTIWGVPYVENEDVPANVAYAVDGRAAAVFDRMDAQIYVTDSNRDLFERNILTILCESRLAFPVFRPETIAKIDLVATS